MGGELIIRIIRDAPWVRDRSVRLILQPMTKPEVLRAYLSSNGYEIQREITVTEGKIYTGESNINDMKTEENLYPDEAFFGHFYIVDNLRKVLRGEGEPVVKPEETLNVCKIIDLIYGCSEEK